jgi:hypothetical protein
MRARIGETKSSWFRAERYYHTNHGWWCTTRENSELGPYSTQYEAENELVLYIRKVNLAGDIPTFSH